MFPIVQYEKTVFLLEINRGANSTLVCFSLTGTAAILLVTIPFGRTASVAPSATTSCFGNSETTICLSGVNNRSCSTLLPGIPFDLDTHIPDPLELYIISLII